VPRGGRRQGLPGKQYGNRTDLALAPRKLPIGTAPDQEYGQAKTLQDSQRSVPMGTGALPGLQPNPAQNPMASAQQFTPPPVTPMSAPTMNPGEPVTTGPASQLAPNPILAHIAQLTALGNTATPETKAILAVLTAGQNNQQAP
jgi:hypothetical protein